MTTFEKPSNYLGLIETLVAGLLAIYGAGSLTGCSTQVLHTKHSQALLKNEEFDQAIHVVEIPAANATPIAPQNAPSGMAPSGDYVRFPGLEAVPGSFTSARTKLGQKKYTKPVSLKKKRKSPKGGADGIFPSTAIASTSLTGQGSIAPPNPGLASELSTAHEPSLEDGEEFKGRRPVADPFRVGEKTTLEMSYFGVGAGDMTIEVRPFVQVNGHKSYQFAGTAVSTSVFAMFYAVDDWFETYVDYETLTPSNYALHVKETKQLRETRSVFDWNRKLATWWDKKIDQDEKVEEKKKEWEIPVFSQNIFSAAYYLRTFQLRPGKKIAFRVAHEGDNLVVTAEVLRREKLTTPMGDIDTVVIKPKIELNGNFRPVGDIFAWLTDDDRKFIVRIESKIKIGTIVATVKSIEPGK